MIILVEVMMIIVVLLLGVSSSLFIKLSSLETDEKPTAANTWEGVDEGGEEY